MTIGRTCILVLNHNGRALLEECLPSVARAAAACPVPCAITVVDNSSTDDSRAWLAHHWPNIHVDQRPNRGLVSFNEALKGLNEPVVLLLNNDVKLAFDAVAPLLNAFERHEDALFSAPQCWTFDCKVYEGMRTRVRIRRGLVQGMCRIPGHERVVNTPDLTAAAGPVLAVHRQRFLALGGYDPLYLPGRIEDLDLGYSGWMRGWRGYYVPESLAFHKGLASFGPSYGKSGCDRLALRNSLLFAWKNLAGKRLWQHVAWLPARLIHAAFTGRTGFPRALLSAGARIKAVLAARAARGAPSQWISRQEAFFERFSW